MRHLKKGKKFGRERDQRRALMKSLTSSFFVTGKMKTTEAKAKAVRPIIEKLLTRAKNPSVNNRRILSGMLAPATLAKAVEQARSLQNRDGGYLRIIKLGQRKSDGARMAIIELVK